MSADEVSRWLDYARSDLGAAQSLLQGPALYLRQVCFLAQQAGEKALKALLLARGVNFSYTHDLDHLREGLPSGSPVKSEFPHLYALSIWAVEARYPGDEPEVTADEARGALQLAERVLLAVERDLRAGGPETS